MEKMKETGIGFNFIKGRPTPAFFLIFSHDEPLKNLFESRVVVVLYSSLITHH